MSRQLRCGPAAAFSVAWLATLAGCGATPPRAITADHVAPPPEPRELLDGTYDWHVLLIAPLGSVLKDVPLTLHEVLLFRDEAHAAAGPAPECYAADAPAPRFFAAALDEYVLCFDHDHLARIQATVRVAAPRGPAAFAAACAGWTKNAAGAGQTPDTCEGRDDGTHFNARLETDAAAAAPEAAASQATVSIVLDRGSDP